MKTGSVMNAKTEICDRPSRPKQNIDAVRESVEDEPRMPIQRSSQQLKIPRTTLWRVVHKDLENGFQYGLQRHTTQKFA